MTRRDLIRLSAGAPILGGSPSAAAWQAKPTAALYPGVRYHDYSRCLPDYLTAVAAEARGRRERALAQLTTPGRIATRQRWARETFWRLAGGQPERTPLNPKVTGEEERQGYKLQKIVYESRPNLHIAANLYIPSSGRPPYPGVLFQMGHSANGKAYNGYQKCCQGLARLGYLVLAFDPMGQGERIYYPRPGTTASRLTSADSEHTLPGKQMLLVGDTSSRFQVWDAVRSLDYLAAHPMVDPARLSSTGQSGGGTLTMLLACVDDRLSCAAVSSGNTENLAAADFNSPGSSDDAEQDFINSGPAGFDRWDLLYPIAPKPLLILVSAKDWFGTYSPNYIRDGWSEYQKLRKVYETLGAEQRIAWKDSPLPHALSYPMRLEIYRWFERWLKPVGDAREIADEPSVSPEPDERLWASPGGNVVRAFRGETPFSLVRKPPEKKRGLWKEAIAAEIPARETRFSELGRSPLKDVMVTAVEAQAAPRVWLPAWIYEPRPSRAGLPAVLVLDPGGRIARWQEDGPWHQRAAAGEILCAADVRGTGDSLPEFPRGAARHGRSHEEEEAYAWSSLVLGRPLLGQRMTDIVALARALANRTGGQVSVEAEGKLTVPALFAAALCDAIAVMRLGGGLISYQSVIETEEPRCPTANLAFGLLNEIDLPELAASLAPRKVVLKGMVDAAGRAVPRDEVRKLYPFDNVEVL